MMKKISLFLSFVGFFATLSAFINDFYQIELLYVVNFKNSYFVKDVLVLEKYYNVDGKATDLYYIEGHLKNNKVEKTIMGYMPSLDKDKYGDFLVWYCNWNNRNFVLKRKTDEKSPSSTLLSAWINLLFYLYHHLFITYV